MCGLGLWRWVRFLLGAAIVLAPESARAQAGPTPPPAEKPAPPPAPKAPPAKREPDRITMPTLVGEIAVDYPEGAAGEATVSVVVTIAADGSVTDAVAENAAEPFASAATAAARKAKFEPATRNGAAVPSKIRLEIVFRPPEVVPAPPAPTGDDAKPGEKPEAPPPPPPKGEVQEVEIVGARPDPSRTATLSRNEVRQIPGTFGDPFRAIEIMPGVTPVVTGLPFFFIRGAPPGNVGYFLDGIRVPLLFHVGIGPSAVHPALIERVDLYPGGYPAKFGRFSGGIVSGETVAPTDKTHGEWNVRLFDVGALAEAPFGKEDRGHVLLGGRYSYTAALLSALSQDTVLDYWDYQARATYDLTRDDRIGVFTFGSYDFLGQRGPLGVQSLFGAEFHRADLRYDRRVDKNGAFRLAATVGLDRSRLQDERFVRARLVGTRSDFVYRLSKQVTFRAGNDAEITSYDVQIGGDVLNPSQARVAGFFPTRSDLVLGVRSDFVIDVLPGFTITPGSRLDFYSSQGATALAVDPRLSMRTAITPRLALLSAMGIAHQAPSFVVPVPGFQPGGLRGGLQKSYQESAGLELDLGGATTATATVFHNAFSNMSDPAGATPMELGGCPPGSFPAESLAGDRGRQPGGNTGCGQNRFPPGTIGPDRSGGGGQGADSSGGTRAANAFEVRTEGRAYGLELFLKRKLTSRVGGFFSYTLSRSQRTLDGRTYTATFDRTHVVNTALAFDLGRAWRAGTRVTFYTGLPKVVDPTSDATRLPPFFRVDLRIEKRWQLGKGWWISAVAEWMNATLSKEAVSTTCTLNGCEYQEIGPVTIPSLGAEGGF